MSGTIPASAVVDVTPAVLGAGGSALALSGLFLTTNERVPIGTVPSFPSQAAVAAYFGSTSQEAGAATVYFNGFTNSNVKPAAILFSQYPIESVGAYLRGGDVSALTLTQLQALSGVLTVTVDGTPHTSSSISLASATSFSNASQAITTALGLTGPTEAVATGSIGCTFTGAISTTVLTASALTSGILSVGDTLVGSGITAGTTILAQLTGTTGLAGTYTVSASQSVGSESMTTTSVVGRITAVGSGTVAVGQQITGSGVTADTFITALGTGTGGTGLYTITPAQHVTSETLTMVTPTCTYDSTSGGFIVISGTTGASSTIGFGSGTISAGLKLTEATGAVTSQGAVAYEPAAAMDDIVLVSQDWGTFTTLFDPDDGSGNDEKLLFAAWVNGQNDAYVYVAWDTDITPTESTTATTSLGYILQASGSSGTVCIYEPTDLNHAAFFMGAAASIDFTQTQGRITFKFKYQSGLSGSGLDQTEAANLEANGYNYYNAFAARANGWTFFAPGSISGPFLWADAYVNQIWMSDAFQVALVNMLVALKSIPYNAAGRAQIDAALSDPIQAALNFGAIQPGVTLSASQKSQINTAAGANVADTIQIRGWYLQVKDATPAVRAARGSPPCTFWYTDGGSIQTIDLTSVEVQ